MTGMPEIVIICLPVAEAAPSPVSALAVVAPPDGSGGRRLGRCIVPGKTISTLQSVL